MKTSFGSKAKRIQLMGNKKAIIELQELSKGIRDGKVSASSKKNNVCENKSGRGT